MKRLSMGAACAALAMLAVGCGSASSSSSGGSSKPAASSASFGVNAKGTVIFYQRAATAPWRSR